MVMVVVVVMVVVAVVVVLVLVLVLVVVVVMVVVVTWWWWFHLEPSKVRVSSLLTTAIGAMLKGSWIVRVIALLAKGTDLIARVIALLAKTTSGQKQMSDLQPLKVMVRPGEHCFIGIT